jgi:hypothetical protein
LIYSGCGGLFNYRSLLIAFVGIEDHGITSPPVSQEDQVITGQYSHSTTTTHTHEIHAKASHPNSEFLKTLTASKCC